MKKIGAFFVIFAASLLGVLVAFQVHDHFRHNGEVVGLDGNAQFPYVSPVSYAPLPPGPPDFVEAAKRINSSVVAVDQRVAVRDIFSGNVQVQTEGTGSGVIIRQDGLILTNNHVIANAQFVTVRTMENKAYSAKVIGADPRSDLALIKINAQGLQPAELGDSSTLQVGQWVLAVGNPLGYTNTVSAGVVSSLGRTLPESDEGPGILLNAIQTDAAINPGNSGGPLTNAQGQVVGINSVIASNNGGSVGLGFAIPIDQAKRVVHDILAFGHVRYGDPGFTVYDYSLADPDVAAAMQNQLGEQPPSRGLIVQQVVPGSPAAHAGLGQLDVVESLDGKVLRSPVDLSLALAEKRPGDEATLKVWHQGAEKTIDLRLADLDSS